MPSREEIENKFFVAGQMDAQGHAAEKMKIGSGGTVLAMSRRFLSEARSLMDEFESEIAALRAELETAKSDSLRNLASGMRKVLTEAEVNLVTAEIQRGIARDARLAEPEDNGPHGPSLTRPKSSWEIRAEAAEAQLTALQAEAAK